MRNVRLSVHFLYLLADLGLRTSGCSLDDRIFFDRYSADDVLALLPSTSCGAVREALLRQHEEPDHLRFRLTPDGRATVSGELSDLASKDWNSFAIDADRESLARFLVSFREAVESAR